MPYKGHVAFIPLGAKGQVAHENRLLSAIDELVDASGVVFEDDHLTRERGALLYGSIPGETKITAARDWYSDKENTITLGAGTLTTTAGSAVVTATVSSFSGLGPGDRIVVANEMRVIASKESNTQVTTTDVWQNSNSVTPVSYKYRVGNRLVSATVTGKLFKELPLTTTTGDLDFTTLKSGLVKDTNGWFVEGGKEAAANNRKLFYFNGVDPVQVLSGDGSTTAALTTPPTDWGSAVDQNTQPIAGVIHESRLAAWGNQNDAHRIYFSDPDNHEDFTTTSAFTIRFRSDIGDRIYSVVSFQGVLFVWKFPRGVMYLDDTDLSTDNWNIRVKSQALGCAPTPYAALAMDDDILFMAADGSFHLLSAVSDLGGVRASDITRALGIHKWLRDNLNLQRLHKVQSAWHPHKKTAYFAVPRAGSLFPDRILKFDFGAVARGGAIRFSYSDRDTPGALCIRRDQQGGPETPILAQGVDAYLLDQSDRNKNGASYTTIAQTPHLDFGDLDPSFRFKRKEYDRIEPIFETSGASGTVSAEVYVNGTLRQTLTFDPTRRRDPKLLTCGDGHTISVKLTQSGVNANYKLLGLLIYFRAGNEDSEVARG